jgi:diguanylate cyclase (GGDEF)-like protein
MNPIPSLQTNQVIRAEAENPNNEFIGTAQIRNCTTCPDKQRVHNIGYGSRVNIRFIVPDAGRYMARFHYNIGPGQGRPCVVMVNDVSQGKVLVPGLADWNQTATFAVMVKLKVGENVIGCDAPKEWSVDLDSLEIGRDVRSAQIMQPFPWDHPVHQILQLADVRPIWGFVVFVAVGLMASLSVLIRSFRATNQSGAFRAVLWMSISISVILGAYLVDMFDDGLILSSLSVRLRFLGIGVTAALAVVLALRYSGQSQLLAGRIEWFLFTLAGLFIVLYVTDPWTRFMFSTFYFNTDGHFSWDEGIGFIIGGSFSWILLFTSSGLMLTYLPRISGYYRKQLNLMLLATLSPHVIGHLVGTPLARLGIYPEIHYLSIAIAPSAVLLAIVVFRYRLLEHTPELWGRGVDITSDLALVTDTQGRLIEGNEVAHQQLKLEVGRTLEQVIPPGPNFEIHDRHYQVSRSHVTGDHGLHGELITLHDVTSLKRTELKLRDANCELEELRDELRIHAIRDKLTGVFNRRHMDATLEGWVETVRESNQDLSIVLFDIDHFRQFNARWGHEGGDQVLREIGVLLNTRDSDQFIPCRYGGEEFCVILPTTDLENARLIAEKLREDVKQLEVTFKGRGMAVTISASVASFKSHGEHMLRSDADAALRKAKVKGRNRVELPSKPKQTWGTGWG